MKLGDLRSVQKQCDRQAGTGLSLLDASWKKSVHYGETFQTLPALFRLSRNA